ncbi:MAG: EAL domain-containing protein [Gammaproteobacteria bacterium]|nr:EAL domain-containing protein [Gammaproteobacteria bacterium]NND59257.1 EAL domain-containing protein [Gammaproteobacteria bacterium]
MSGFRDFDLDRYGQLLRQLLPGAIGFSMCDSAGLRRWSSACSNLDSCVRAVAILNKNHENWAVEDVDAQTRELDEMSVAITVRVDSSDPEAGTLFALVPADGTDLEQQKTSLQAVAACLASENGMLAELDGMAGELASRYEELNLIYVTDDNVKYFDEGQDALRRLVQNTGRYLDTDLTALVMADRKIITSQGNRAVPLISAEKILNSATGDLYERVRFMKDAVVLNDMSSDEGLPRLPQLPCKLLAAPVLDENGAVIGVLLIANATTADDFTTSDAKLMRVMARKAARIIQVNYDSLTGMMTRHGFEYHLETALYIVRYKRIEHCVMHINLDRMHVVNDTCSHHAGDELIRRVATKIREHLGESDIVARTGGDSFSALLGACSLERGREVANELREAINKIDFKWDKRRFEISVSIGLAAMAAESESIVTVVGAAEMACAKAKSNGRNRVEIYERDSTLLSRRRAEIEWVGHLHNALREDRFQLYSQRIEPLQDASQLPHTEILLRLRTDNGEVLGPNEFIPAAERYNLMPAIDRWVVRNTLKMLSANLPRRVRAANVWAINLSGQSIGDGAFLEFVTRETSQAAVPPESICFEITETAAVADLDQACRFVEALKERGFRFALDDFGTGLSSFAYLKSLPVDYLKIDGTFVREIADDRISESMVSAITQIGHVMGLETIAEFVENDAIRDCLVRVGVTFGQGYGIERPRPLMSYLSELTPELVTLPTAAAVAV